MRDSSTILHVDLDAFFASVEQRDNAKLRGRPVLVGGSQQRGVVAAASYEARRFGIHSAMPMATALRLCPQAVVVKHRMERYTEASRKFFSILRNYSPDIEGISVDEAFVDVAGSVRLFGPPPTIARSIKNSVSQELSLIASVGVAPTKFVAKIASDIDKPDGLRVVEPRELLDFLHALPISRLWGVGKVGQQKLADLGLRTIGQVAAYPEEVLRARLGEQTGLHVARLARGEDDRSVCPGHGPVTVGHEQTFSTDKSRASELIPTLVGQADRVAGRLRRAGLRARVVVLKIKYGDFRSVTRRATLPDPTSDGAVLVRALKRLLAGLEVSDRLGKATQVRLCGVAAAGLEDRNAPRQLVFGESQRNRGESLGDAIDELERRYGPGTIERASTTKRS